MTERSADADPNRPPARYRPLRLSLLYSFAVLLTLSMIPFWHCSHPAFRTIDQVAWRHRQPEHRHPLATARAYRRHASIGSATCPPSRCVRHRPRTTESELMVDEQRQGSLQRCWGRTAPRYELGFGHGQVLPCLGNPPHFSASRIIGAKASLCSSLNGRS